MAEVAAVLDPADTGARSERLSRRAQMLLVIVALAGAALLSQHLMDAYSGFIGVYPDEAGHYMSGLLVHDYVRAKFPEPPMAYAKRYYYHHPALGIGYWPPAFYLAEALWMLALGTSRTSVLVFGAGVCACLQFMLFRSLRLRTGVVAAFVVAVSLPFLPAVRDINSMVMTDVFVALACFGATLSLGSFLDRPTWRRGVALGLWCSFALLSKFSAGYLLLVPLLAIALSSRFHVLLRPAILVPPIVVLLVTAPWIIYTHELTTLGLLPYTVVGYQSFSVIADYVLALYGAAGAVVVAAAVGCIAIVFGKARQDAYWASIASTPAALGIFACFAPVDLEPRHMIIAIPSMLMLAVFGIQAVAARIRPANWKTTVSTITLMAMLSSAMADGPRSVSFDGGFAKVAEYLISASAIDSVILVSSTVIWKEPAMVAELAQREPERPGRRTVRSRKLLAETDWNATYYRQRFQTANEVLSELRRTQVQHIAVHSSGAAYSEPRPHVILLLDALRQATAEWREVRRFDGNPGEQTVVFSRVDSTVPHG